MITKPSFPLLAAIATLAAAPFLSSCSEQDESASQRDSSSEASQADAPESRLRSPFESLPDSTVAAARLDNSESVRQRYVESTRLGALLLSDEKVAEYKEFLRDFVESDEDGVRFLEGLNEVGLELEDLYGILSSHFGGAIVETEIEGANSMPTVFLWAEMDPEIAEHIYSSILDAAGEEEDMERIDQEMAGVIGSRIRNVERGDSFLTALLENRFLFGLGMPVDPIESMEAAEVYEAAEWESFGRFVQAQQENGDGFLTRIYDELGAGLARPDFEARLEVLGDLTRALDYVPAQSAQMVELFNLREFKTLAIWSGLAGNEERSKAFVGSTAPRSGLARAFELEPFNFDVPPWVPSSATTYSTLALDLSLLYEVGLDVARSAMSPQVVDQRLSDANAMLQQNFAIDLETLLASFGGRVHAIEFPLETVEVETGEQTLEVPQTPTAVVLDFERPDVLDKAMAMVGAFASNPESGIELFYEQGFSGIRMDNPTGAVVVAHALGKLVFATGETAANRTFAVLNNAPAGSDALVNDADFRDFMQRSNLESGIAFSYTAGDNAMKNLAPSMEIFMQAMRKAAEGKEDQLALLDELKALLPSEEELEGLLGAVFTRAYYDDSGFFFESVNELP